MLTHSLLESTILLPFKLSPSQQTLILTQNGIPYAYNTLPQPVTDYNISNTANII